MADLTRDAVDMCLRAVRMTATVLYISFNLFIVSFYLMTFLLGPECSSLG